MRSLSPSLIQLVYLQNKQEQESPHKYLPCGFSSSARILAIGVIFEVNLSLAYLACSSWITQFQPSVSFHIETSHFFCSAKQMTGFYRKRNIELKWVKLTPNYFTAISPKCFEKKFPNFSMTCKTGIRSANSEKYRLWVEIHL